MKKLKYLVPSILLAFSLGSCEENEMPKFDKEYAALNIWFERSQSALDSITYNYSYSMGEGSLTFKARVAGIPTDYDRPFELEVYGDDVDEATGSFRTETYTLKAGETEVECPIYFNTSLLTNKDSFTHKDGHLYFRVAENKYFSKGVDERNTLVVVLKNYLSKPEDWDDTSLLITNRLSYYFGEYSKVKYQFMISVLGLIDFHVNSYTSTLYDEESNTVSATYANYLLQKVKVALEEYNNDPSNPDTPLKDETGNVVTF